MFKLRQITHKFYINPWGFTQFVSDSPDFTHIDKIHINNMYS